MKQLRRNGTSYFALDEVEMKNAWIEGARQLSEEGRVAWLLGESLQEIFRSLLSSDKPIDAGTAKMQLSSLVQEACGHSLNSVNQPTHDINLKPQRKRKPTSRQHRLFSWSDASTDRLDKRSYPIVFIGTKCVRRVWCSVAIGVDMNGSKHVLGGRNDGDVPLLLADLSDRGLAANDGLLVVSEGNRRSDEAVMKLWSGRARVQHCISRLRRDLRDLAPETEHVAIEEMIKLVRYHPVDEAKASLETLLERLRTAHPGAADRLQRSMKCSLTVARLGIHRTLRRHTHGLGVVRVACTEALKTSDPMAKGLEAIAAGIGDWYERHNRLSGYEYLPELAERLRESNEDTNCEMRIEPSEGGIQLEAKHKNEGSRQPISRSLRR